MHILFDSAVPTLGVYSTDIFTRAKSWMCRVIYCSSSRNSQRLEQSKSLSETNVMYNTYVQALEKMVPVNLCVWHKRDADRRTDSWTQWGKEREGELGEQQWDIYRQPVGICYLTQELNQGLWDNLEGWDGVGGRGEAPEGGGVGIPMADSCWCLAETNTTL